MIKQVMYKDKLKFLNRTNAITAFYRHVTNINQEEYVVKMSARPDKIMN